MNRPRQTRVEDVMTAEVHSIDGLATVSEAIALMQRHSVSSLVVNRRDDTDEIGMVVVSDIARNVIAPNRSPDRVNVYEIMSKPVLTLPSEMLARYAVRLLVRFDISRATVVDYDRNPVGIVTLRDLVLGSELA
ncbi:MAG: CBS domain-containing protein [Dehalococcoidia bacterium]|nr:CBS domain-containing protein [Dehalococcoidia bacterium]